MGKGSSFTPGVMIGTRAAFGNSGKPTVRSGRFIGPEVSLAR
jgi:hypothetical protein